MDIDTLNEVIDSIRCKPSKNIEALRTTTSYWVNGALFKEMRKQCNKEIDGLTITNSNQKGFI